METNWNLPLYTIYSNNKYLMGVCYVPGHFSRFWGSSNEQNKNYVYMDLTFIMCMNMCVLVEETKNTKIIKETLVYIIKW